VLTTSTSRIKCDKEGVIATIALSTGIAKNSKIIHKAKRYSGKKTFRMTKSWLIMERLIKAKAIFHKNVVKPTLSATKTTASIQIDHTKTEAAIKISMKLPLYLINLIISDVKT